MRCDRCGTENGSNVKFCSSCGSKLLTEATAASEEAVVIKNKGEKPDVLGDMKPEQKVEEKVNETVKNTEEVKEKVEESVVTPVAPVQEVAPQVKPQPVPQSAQQAVQQPTQQVAQQPVAPQPVQQTAQQQKPVKPNKKVYNPDDPTTRPMGFWGWLWTLIVVHIPVIDFIFLLVWSFSSGTNRSKRSFAHVVLVLRIILFILFILGLFNLFYFIQSFDINSFMGPLDGILDEVLDALIQ